MPGTGTQRMPQRCHRALLCPAAPWQLWGCSLGDWVLILLFVLKSLSVLHVFPNSTFVAVKAKHRGCVVFPATAGIRLLLSSWMLLKFCRFFWGPKTTSEFLEVVYHTNHCITIYLVFAAERTAKALSQLSQAFKFVFMCICTTSPLVCPICACVFAVVYSRGFTGVSYGTEKQIVPRFLREKNLMLSFYPL